MPANLHALIRYRTLDRCFRDSEHSYKWQELASACEEELYFQMGIEKKLSRRTIMYDIQNMKSGILGYEAPIEYDREEGYYYSRPNFSIHLVPLNQQDLGELSTALMILKQFSGNEQITGLEHVLTKLENSLNIKQHRKRSSIIYFEHSLNEPGQRWVNVLYQHIKSKHTLLIAYQPFGRESKPIIISPYLIKEYDNRWFLIGHSNEYKGVITLGLDRMQNIQKSLVAYHQSVTFDPKEWFVDIIGVSQVRDGEKTKIQFKAYDLQINYIATKPLHPSQKLIKETKKYSLFEIEVIPNYELISLFLSFGETIEIIKPGSVRTAIRKRLEEAIKRY